MPLTNAARVCSNARDPRARRVLFVHTVSRKTRRFSQGRRRPATQTSLGTTTGPAPRKQRVTVFNDDGRVPWGQLTRREQVARTAQQSFNFTLVGLGAVLTAAIFFFMYTDVFSPQSSTSHFNRAVDRIRADPRCKELLGGDKEISAYGEPTWNKWRRNRPIASKTETDKFGTERLYMHFNVSGSKADGVVNLHMLRRSDERQFQYGYLALDVPGQQRVYLENADAEKKTPKKDRKILGFRFG